MVRYKEREKLKKHALERIKVLFREAKEQFKDNKPELADRYVFLARKAAMKINLRLSKEIKRKFCKHCYKYIVPGVNCRVRINNNRVIYYCFNCRKYMRFMLKPLKKKIRTE